MQFIQKVKKVHSNPIAQKVKFLLIYIIGLLILLDVFWALTGEGTISGVIRCHVMKTDGIWLPWIWGVLAGHLFFDRKYNLSIVKEIHAILIIILITILLGIMGYAFVLKDNNIYLQGFLLIFGFLAGFFLWPQKTKET